MSNKKLPADKWIKKDREWSEYPEGTKAIAVMGGHWVKVKRGWKWHLGDTFPSPGGDATGEVCLPVDQLPTSKERIKADADKLYPLFLQADTKEGYIAGATALYERAQAILGALDLFISYHESGLLPAKHVYEKAVVAREQWKKEVENG